MIGIPVGPAARVLVAEGSDSSVERWRSSTAPQGTSDFASWAAMGMVAGWSLLA